MRAWVLAGPTQLAQSLDHDNEIILVAMVMMLVVVVLDVSMLVLVVAEMMRMMILHSEKFKL